jgi:SH3-like domain-containing protein
VHFLLQKLLKQLLITTGLVTSLLFVQSVAALEFRSVSIAKAILYDAPSVEAEKLYLLSQGYPVELIVNLGEWIKIRDAQGSLSWIESKSLNSKRTAIVNIVQAEMRIKDDETSAVVANIEQNVVVELLSPIKNGWVKVRHRDGLTGFVLSTSLWGVN